MHVDIKKAPDQGAVWNARLVDDMNDPEDDFQAWGGGVAKSSARANKGMLGLVTEDVPAGILQPTSIDGPGTYPMHNSVADASPAFLRFGLAVEAMYFRAMGPIGGEGPTANAMITMTAPERAAALPSLRDMPFDGALRSPRLPGRGSARGRPASPAKGRDAITGLHYVVTTVFVIANLIAIFSSDGWEIWQWLATIAIDVGFLALLKLLPAP